VRLGVEEDMASGIGEGGFYAHVLFSPSTFLGCKSGGSGSRTVHRLDGGRLTAPPSLRFSCADDGSLLDGL
jgi:hypothetical protein